MRVLRRPKFSQGQAFAAQRTEGARGLRSGRSGHPQIAHHAPILVFEDVAMVGKFPDDRRSGWTEPVAANRLRCGLNRPSRLELAAAPRRFDRRLADVAGFDPDPGVGRRICWFEKGPILTILDANLTAVEMLFSCFVIRQTRVAQRTGTLPFRGLQAMPRLVTLVLR